MKQTLDSINRFLVRENYTPKDLFDEVRDKIELVGGTISVDDMVIDKPYSHPKTVELIAYFWSGKHHKIVKGINLITLYYTDLNGVSIPVNYRIVNKQEGKTKHEYFLEMLEEVIAWGLKPSTVTGDSWYASKDNLNFLKNKDFGGLFALEANRLVSLEKGKSYVQVQTLEIPNDGLIVYLKQVGRVKVFRTKFKNDFRYYVRFFPNSDSEQLESINPADFEKVHAQHWGIEQYHRAVKQVCNIERFQVRVSQAIRTHIFCSIRAFVQLEFLRVSQKLLNWYSLQRELFTEVIRGFIVNNLESHFFELNALEKVA